MFVTGILLVGIGLLACLVACFEYATCSWYLNHCVMGASTAFTSFWWMGGALLACGLTCAMR